jgi:hypothetical protein
LDGVRKENDIGAKHCSKPELWNVEREDLRYQHYCEHGQHEQEALKDRSTDAYGLFPTP